MSKAKARKTRAKRLRRLRRMRLRTQPGKGSAISRQDLLDTIHAIAVHGLGLPDPADIEVDEMPPEWSGRTKLSEQVMAIRSQLATAHAENADQRHTLMVRGDAYMQECDRLKERIGELTNAAELSQDSHALGQARLHKQITDLVGQLNVAHAENAGLRLEMDKMCNAEELRQLRLDSSKLGLMRNILGNFFIGVIGQEKFREYENNPALQHDAVRAEINRLKVAEYEWTALTKERDAAVGQRDALVEAMEEILAKCQPTVDAAAKGSWVTADTLACATIARQAIDKARGGE